MLHYPDQALDKIEEVSYLLKQENLDITRFLVIEDIRNYYTLASSLSDYIQKMEPFFKVTNIIFKYIFFRNQYQKKKGMKFQK